MGMTRDEAIEQLKHMKVFIGYDAESPIVKEMQSALDMATKALEPQPCEDAISIESVIEWLKDKDIIKMKNQEENARRELGELPSAPPSYNSIKTELKPCEDCISREETLNKINELIAEYIPLMPIGWTLPLNIAKTINELPPVKPQSPKGKWIYSKYHTWICSVCGENTRKYTGVVPSEEKMKKRWHYCSICGAEMEGEDETDN